MQDLTKVKVEGLEEVKGESQEDGAKKKSINIKGILEVIAILMAILTPVAYISGLALYQGYLHGFGVNSSVLPISFEETLVHAYWAVALSLGYLVQWLSSAIAAYWAYALLSLMLLLAGAVFYFHLSKSVNENPEYWLNRWRGNKKLINDLENSVTFKSIDFIMAVLWVVAWLVMIIPVVFLLIVQASSIAHSIGLDLSVKDRTIFQAKGCGYEAVGWSKCVTIETEDGVLVSKGLLLASSDDRLAVYTGKESKIMAYRKGYVLHYELIKLDVENSELK